MVETRLILGDCLQEMRSLPDACVDAVITDPPYGIAYQSARRTDKDTRFPVLRGDGSVPTEWLEEAFRITKNSGCLFTFCRWDTEWEFHGAIEKAGWHIQSQVIWDRGIHGLGDLKRQFAPMHDNAWFATKSDYEFPGSRPKSVYRVDRLSADKLEHPTQKPLGLMGKIVLDLTSPGDVIIDPFMGSGTTIEACLKKGRSAIGIEIDPHYFSIAEKRIEQAKLQLPLPF